jgi:hypothetical protein
MSGGRELRHVGADLVDDHLGGAVLDTGACSQQLNRCAEGAGLFLVGV